MPPLSPPSSPSNFPANYTCSAAAAPLVTMKRTPRLTNTMTGRIPPTFLPTSSLLTLPSSPAPGLPANRCSQCKPLNRLLRGLKLPLRLFRRNLPGCMGDLPD
uniref:Uncharacterized protein n=1 Tax=Nelumbo nucifera TaxID=4432 RepID=A0A823A2A5_NELNU|nr:TPA_asm: hypothetical protein HUJ06_019013 [Nelumbo nucifera]